MPYPPFKKRMSKNFDAYIKELKKHQLQAMKPCVHASAFYHVLIALGMALNTIKYVLQQHEDFQVELLKRIVDDLYLIMNDDISADVFYAFYEYAETLVEEMDYEGPEVWTLYEMVDNMMALMDIREEKAAQKRIYQERAKATRHMKLRVKMNRRHKCQRMNKKWT
jgi:hypothetical protein